VRLRLRSSSPRSWRSRLVLAHRVSDGSWLGFIREIHRYTNLQRESFHQDRWTDLLWFPVTQPYYLFGLTLPLFFLGVPRAWRVGFMVPRHLPVLAVSYAFKGVLAADVLRVADAVSVHLRGVRHVRDRDRRRWALPLAFAAAFAHVVWLLVLTGRWTFHA